MAPHRTFFLCARPAMPRPACWDCESVYIASVWVLGAACLLQPKSALRVYAAVVYLLLRAAARWSPRLARAWLPAVWAACLLDLALCPPPPP